jgi:type IV pilus assembly protein PilA
MKKKNLKGFTLIELLVVVAIIGILAAVGVVAYNGYTASAKKNAVKTMHAQTIKYVSAEIQKCALEGSSGKAFGSSSANCGTINGSSGATQVVSDLVANATDKNPYTQAKAIMNSGSYAQGQISVQGSGKTVTIKSCMVETCSGDNVLGPTTVTIE